MAYVRCIGFVLVLMAVWAYSDTKADEKNGLPICTSVAVRTAAAEAVEDAYTLIGMGGIPITRSFSDHIRQTLTAYRGGDNAALERASARAVGIDVRDVRYCTTSKIGGMQIDVWVATDELDKGKWRAVVNNFGMGADRVALSPAYAK